MKVNIGELVTAIGATAALITAISGLILQLRKFRLEIIAAVERHMLLTEANHRLLVSANDMLEENGGDAREHLPNDNC